MRNTPAVTVVMKRCNNSQAPSCCHKTTAIATATSPHRARPVTYCARYDACYLIINSEVTIITRSVTQFKKFSPVVKDAENKVDSFLF